ncbi:50S ribosomal protein L30 [Candidatus Woesearchaeota archaeon]|nr:MAG: 50S ribosomal protein L30 [Candidatus Woesearchaeota archaeon]
MLDEIRKAVKEGRGVIGKEVVLKELRKGGLKKVFLAKNTPTKLVEEVRHLGGLGDVEVVSLDIPNTELGVLCKKPFAIMVLGVR